MTGKRIVPLDFAMSRDSGERVASHQKAADVLRPYLDGGDPVAMLNLGDVSIYASFRYIADILGSEGYPIEMVPGVTSFCAAAAALGATLTDMGTPLRVIPDGSGDPDDLRGTGTTIWMKSGRNLPALLQRLSSEGLADRAMLVQNCGMPGQRIYRGLADAEIEPAYFTVVILKNDAGEADQ